jgi:RNA-directed DNA polymerase
MPDPPRRGARAGARTRFLQDVRGVSLQPQKTRIVHSRQGVEFLGDQGERGQGDRLPDAKRRRPSNPLNLDAVLRQQSVLSRRKVPRTLQEVIDQSNSVIWGWGTFYRQAHVRGLLNRLDRWIARRL